MMTSQHAGKGQITLKQKRDIHLTVNRGTVHKVHAAETIMYFSVYVLR